MKSTKEVFKSYSMIGRLKGHSKRQREISFLTSNRGKFREVAAVIPRLKMLSLANLPEIQSLDIKEIIRANLDVALHEASRRG